MTVQELRNALADFNPEVEVKAVLFQRHTDLEYDLSLMKTPTADIVYFQLSGEEYYGGEGEDE